MLGQNPAELPSKSIQNLSNPENTFEKELKIYPKSWNGHIWTACLPLVKNKWREKPVANH